MNAAAVLNLHAVQHATFNNHDAHDDAGGFSRNKTDSGNARSGNVDVCTANPYMFSVGHCSDLARKRLAM